MSRVFCSSRGGSLRKQIKTAPEENIAFVMQYHVALRNLKNILMGNWHLVQNYIGKKSSKISWSEVIYEDRSLKSLVDGRSVMPFVICTLGEACRRFDAEKSLQIGYSFCYSTS